MCRLRLREREDAVDHRPPRRLDAVREEGVELTRTSQRGAVDGEVTEEEVGDDDLGDVALGVAEADEHSTGPQGTKRTRPGCTAGTVDHGVDEPDPIRPVGITVVGAVSGAELAEA